MNLFRTNSASYFALGDVGGGIAAPVSSSSSAAPTTTPTSLPAAPTAPAATPSPAVPSGTDSPPASDPFAGLDGSFDDQDEIEIIAAPPTDGGTAIPAAPAPAAPAVTPAAPAAPAPASPEPAPAPAASAAPAPTAPASPRAALDEAIEGFKANNKELATHAAQTLFKLSDEDATALATNAEEVIPRLMGQVYTQAIAAAGNLIRNFVPQIIDHQMQQTQTRTAKSQEAVNAFYTANPDLNQQTHGEAVTKWARSFRQANPSATRQQAMDFVSRAVRIEAGLAAPAPNGAASAAPVAFAPARPGGRPPQPTGEKDPYSGLGMDFEE